MTDYDSDTPVDSPVYGWRIVNPKTWEAGKTYVKDVELDPPPNDYRIYEHLYDAVEQLGHFCDRVNMTWLARMKLTGAPYRPARKTCPFRVFDGSIITVLWIADPAPILHKFVLSIITDWISDSLTVGEMINLKRDYCDGKREKDALDKMRGQLDLLDFALNPNPLYSVYHVLLELKQQKERAAVENYERLLNWRLLCLKPVETIE